MKSKAATYIFTGVAITLAIGALVWGAATYFESLRPNDLLFTYAQPISKQPPVFHLDQTIPVEAVFYNTGAEDLTFTALVFWKLVDSDHQVLHLSFQRTIPPGCTEIHFNNMPPQEVVDITKEKFEQGWERVQWQIEGHNAVTDPYSGGLQPFTVELATYIPDDVALPVVQFNDRIQCV